MFFSTIIGTYQNQTATLWNHTPNHDYYMVEISIDSQGQLVRTEVVDDYESHKDFCIIPMEVMAGSVFGKKAEERPPPPVTRKFLRRAS